MRTIRKFFESNLRSIVKTFTFRSVIIISDSIIIYLLTKRVDITVGTIVFSNFASTVLYFLHERVWNRIDWGKTPVKKINPE